MNKAIMLGRLVADPEIRYTTGENSMAVARYRIAVNRIGKKAGDGTEQTADFIPCVAFGKSAEFAEKYLSKGRKILVSGHLQTGSYTNKEGVKVYTTDLVIESQEFADSKPEGNASAEGNGDFMSIPDDVEDSGLPFN